MSKNKHHRASVADGSNAPTMVPTPQPTQEKTMEATPPRTTVMPPEVSGPTAKEMAAAEEANLARQLKLVAQSQEPPPPPPVPIADVAARGYDALHEQFRRHNEQAAKRKEYVPPPRTERQMTALEEELAAGARAVARNKAAQEAAAAQRAAVSAAETTTKEGFTTPVYRPSDVVPDPVTGKLGTFGPEA